MWRWAWVLLLVVPCVELAAHARVVSGVASDAEWQRAAAFVRSEFRAGDLITVAPSWADPTLRLHLGASITLAMAGRSDDSAFERAWVLSLRGEHAALEARGKLELEQDFGRVHVARYALGKSPVLYDFVSQWRTAKPTITRRTREEDCVLREDGVPRGAGLGKGVLYPLEERFDCDARKPWLFIGPVVLEDLSLEPRYCLWQHPQGNAPVSMTFTNVPLGDELVFYGGLYYEHERMRDHGPVRADVFVEGVKRGSLTHRDGEGWKRMSVATNTGNAATHGTVRIEVTAPDPDKRSFCWSASTRRAGAK
jgi:hypothetical protein